MSILFAMVLPWLLVVVGGWLVWQLIAQNGRIVLRLEAIERSLLQWDHRPAIVDELSQGTPAPEFVLADIEGRSRSLAEFRGRSVLLVFFNPHCDFCQDLAEHLAELPVNGANGHPLTVLISAGTLADNRGLVEDFGLRCPVLLEVDTNVAAQYRAIGTPAGYLIDEQGLIASRRVVGGEALLALAGYANATTGNDTGPDGSGDGGVSSNGRPPRLIRRAWSLTQALADFAADGFKTLTEAEYRRRLEICDTCDRRRGNQCLECGCYLKLKARGSAFQCPLGKWPSTDGSDEISTVATEHQTVS